LRLPNGYGSVYKLKGNRRRPWAVAVTVGLIDGRYKRKMLGYYTTQKDALDALSEYNRSPYDLDAAAITLAGMFDKWRQYREKREKPVAVIYTSAFKHCASFHNKRFLDIGAVHIQEMIDNAPSPVIAQRIKQIFNMIYKYAMLTGICQVSQTGAIELPKMPKSHKHKPFTEEEIAELWRNLNDATARLVLVMIYTGLRPSELVFMESRNVHIDERYMTGGMKTEAGRNRTIPIAEKILPIVREWYERGEEYLAPVYPRNKNTMRHLFDRSAIPCIKAHLPHDGRHTCETLLDNARVAKRTIQLIMGHAGRDVDESVYTHKTKGQLIEAINLI